jgi:predicted dinucleotide-binding enzyme
VTGTSSAALSVVVVGSGTVGTAIAANLRSLRHHVRVASRTPGPDGIGIDGAAAGADLTILAVPFGAVSDVVPKLGLRPGDVLVDATNPFGRPVPDGLPGGTALVVQEAGDGVHVVNAFNVLGADHMGVISMRAIRS